MSIIAFIHLILLGFSHSNRLAGSDTTAISLRACFYYTLKHPRVLAKLRDEIKTFEANGQLSKMPTLDETLKMPYL